MSTSISEVQFWPEYICYVQLMILVFILFNQFNQIPMASVFVNKFVHDLHY